MSDIFGLVGLPGAAICVVFLGIVKAFGWIERESSDQAKRDVASFLRSTDWDVLSSKLPDVFWQFFRKIFGERHFSWFCLRRSVYFSTCSIAALLIVGLMLDRGHGVYSYFDRDYMAWYSDPSTFISMITWNIAADYLNLGKSRLFISYVNNNKLSIVPFIFVLILDILVTVTIFAVAYSTIEAKFVATHNPSGNEAIRNVTFAVVLSQLVLPSFFDGPFYSPMTALLYGGFLPSMWFILYMIFGWLAHAGRLMQLPIWLFDIDHHPIKCIGIIAATVIALIMILWHLI